MDMVKVDPQLFVTCRLCLNDIGLYQIVPAVQQQIKYCFDINIEPFDGLPQLICNKCRTILSEYHTTKKTFYDNQQTLLTKLEEKKDKTIQPQPDIVTSPKRDLNEKENKKAGKYKVFKSKRKKAALFFSSSSSEDEDQKTNVALNTQNHHLKESSICWKTGFNRKFECRLCRRYFETKSSLKMHIPDHKNLLLKYPNVYKTNCTVDLIKIDNKSNLTNVVNTVVINEKKIIQNEGSYYYHIIYSPKDENCDLNSEATQCNKIYENSDSSSNDIIIKRNKRRKRRLLSRSSSETIVIEKNNQSPTVPENEYLPKIKIKVGPNKEKSTTKSIECINIDDTSTDSIYYKDNTVLETEETDSNIKQNIEAQTTDYKTIQNIISMCCNKHLKKIHTIDGGSKKNSKQGNLKALLIHKVLSIGRKVINKQGINCTGILRFLESENLDIIWIPTLSSNKETNCVRILTKLKVGDESDHCSGWKNLQITEDKNILEKNIPDQCRINKKSELETAEEIDSLQDHFYILPTDTNRPEKKTLFISKTKIDAMDNDQILHSIGNNANIDTNMNLKNKVLNSNPVANPKKLPKKTNIEIKPRKIEKSTALQNSNQDIPSENDIGTISIDLDDSVDNTLCMPVITSTTSLASILSEDIGKEQNDVINIVRSDDVTMADTNNVACSERAAPRIKVKPVSELMPQNIDNFCQQQPYVPPNIIWSYNRVPFNNTINPVYGNNMVSQTASQTSNYQMVSYSPYNTMITPQVRQVQNTATPAQQTSQSGYVILDTVEFPNTKTTSPFKYFANLLQVHGMILLETEEILPQEFICLIKFKVLFKQEDKDLVLCLLLFCAKNKFCFKVKYSNINNHVNVDVRNISANWQWEILKTYRGDIVKKLLQNAQKVSQDVYEYTNRFVCLLKSINFKIET